MIEQSGQRGALHLIWEHRLTLWLLGFLALLYIPYAGNYGLWDPWETHFGEVARQMVERNDWISLWWPGSPQDGATFWSKPVLTFWLMALSMKLFGLGHGGVAHAAEMTQGWRAEWALRLPFVLLSIAGVWSVWHLVRRVCGPRAALISAVVLATGTQWALITRQAMTDMAFVTPMTMAMVFAGLALIQPDEEMQRELPRRQWSVGGARLSWPHAPAFYVFLGVYLLCVVPQLVVDCVQLQSWTFVLFGRTFRTLGFVPMLPWVALFLLSLGWIFAVRDRRSIYILAAYFLGGIANLAKGPAGIAIPVIVLFLFLLASGRMREFLGRRRDRPWFFKGLLPGPLRHLAYYDGGLEVLRGTLVFLCVGAPWYAAMLVRHGPPFWMEFIGDNYVHRAQGRHGDRGTYEYYLRQLCAGMFPWSGAVLSALLVSGRWLRQWAGTARHQLLLLSLCWFVAHLMIVSLVNTKFHHYILPAVPPLAIVCGLFLDELCERAERGLSGPRDSAFALGLIGLPVTWLAGRDLANFPARIGWLFNYDYVNAPGGGRPWPVVATYGNRYEYLDQIYVFAAVAALATAVLTWVAAREPGPAQPETQAAADDRPARPLRLVLGGLVFAALLAVGILIAPSPETVAHASLSSLPASTVPPALLRLGWIVPSAGAGIFLLGFAMWRRRLFPGGRAVTLAGAFLGLVGVAWTCWVLDRFMIDLSPHWSQKHVFATYYKLRKGPQEPVVAWQMYWRGENFYTTNQIYDHRLDNTEKTVFLGDRNSEKLQAYVTAHRNRRIFFLIERHRLEALRALLPQEARQSLQVVDESNNKVYLAVAQL